MHSVIKKPFAEIYLSQDINDIICLDNLGCLLEKYFQITDCIESADIYVGKIYNKNNPDLLQILLDEQKSIEKKETIYEFKPYDKEDNASSIDINLLVDFILTVSNIFSMPVKHEDTILVTY